MRQYVACLVVCAALCVVCTRFVFPEPALMHPTGPPAHSPVVDRAYVIALPGSPVEDLTREIREHLGLAVEVTTAVNASEALRYASAHPEDVPVYVQHTMRFGRHHHMQIGNPEMLGCLLSHVAVWERFLGSGDALVAVFEEDASLSERSREVLWELYEDLSGPNLARHNLTRWSILMLDQGHANSGYGSEVLGRQLRRCEGGDCEWYGTRGYLLTRGGAEALLRKARPATVQVDSLIYLLDRWDGDFTMLWTGTSVAQQRSMLRVSAVFDGCVKCYMPLSAWVYVLSLAVVVILSGGLAVGAWEAVRAARRAEKGAGRLCI